MSTITYTDVLKKFRGVISVLRYLAATRQFSYVDRLAAAMSPDEVRAVIIESLRTIRSAIDSSIEVKDVDGRAHRCCEVDEGTIPPYAEGVAIEVNVKECSRRELEGRRIICYVCPKIPSEYEVANLLDYSAKDLEVAKTVAAYALTLSYTGKK